MRAWRIRAHCRSRSSPLPHAPRRCTGRALPRWRALATASAQQLDSAALQAAAEAGLARVPGTHYGALHFALSLLAASPIARPEHKQHLRALEILEAVVRPSLARSIHSDGADLTATAPASATAAVSEGSGAALDLHALVASPWAVMEPRLTPETARQLAGVCCALGLEADELHVRLVTRAFTVAVTAPAAQRDAAVDAPPVAASAAAAASASEPTAAAAAAGPLPDPLPLLRLLAPVRSAMSRAVCALWLAERYPAGEQRALCLQQVCGVQPPQRCRGLSLSALLLFALLSALQRSALQRSALRLY